MAAALIELSEVLRSKIDKDKITTSESLLIGNCMAKSVKNFFIGAVASSAVVYRATRRLGRWYSFYLSAGSGLLIGRMVIDRSANACLEQILSIEGSRMQRELANIILWKHRESPSRMQMVLKYFHPEVVFTDQKPDKPFIRWRARNVYEDETPSQRTEDNGDCSDDVDAKALSPSQSKSKLDPANTFHSNLGEDLLTDPLDCIVFGNQESSEEIRHADGANIRRSQRRARRTARRHHRDHETYSHSTKG
ncbi:hypothetical protein M5K25_008739 [Dendrobium thyrsiflorum]|uniref:Transmembrane protein n=1 Tax=Dendrobium thyrsiflorum TaxID=117978 RepID=A0ABD0V9C3_DENTH